MSVGKDSILRAANADAKTTEVKAEAKPAEEVKAPAKSEAAKAPAAKKAPAKKTAAKKTTTAAKNNNHKEDYGKKENCEDICSHTTEFRRASGSICEKCRAGNGCRTGSHQRRSAGISSVTKGLSEDNLL